MNSKLSIACLSAMSILSAPVALAEEAKKDWTAQSEVGFLKTTGNSESETLKAKLSGTKSYNDWKHSGSLSALNTSQNDDRSAEKYTVATQSDYSLSERSYALASLN